MNGDRNVLIRLRGDISDFNAKMIAAGKSVGAVTDKMTGAEKESVRFRQGLTSVGDAAGKIGLAAAAGVGAAVAVAADFDQAMSHVQAATHESASAMEELRQAAIQAGADTAFSASEAAAGIENLAKAGVETQEILGGGLQGALDLAAAGTMEVADAAEAAAGAMAQFGLDGSEVPHIADLLAAAAGKAQGEVSDMVMALKQGGTVAAQTGLTLEETTGALAAMAEQSLLGSDAGTSFKQMLASLTPSTEKAASAMEQYGISAFDANGNFVGMVELAAQLRQGLSDLTDEQRMSTLETIFGSDAVRAASIIYDQGEAGIRDWIAAVDDQGYAAETASIKLDNLKGDLEALKGSLETALIGAGDGGQGALRPMVQNLTDAVNVFNKLDPAMQGAVTQMLAITAITGGGLWFGSKVVQGVASTREAMEALGGSSSKASRAMRGVTGAAAGFAALTAATAAVKALNDALDEDLPSGEALVSDLLAVTDRGVAEEFNSIAESIRRMTNPSFSEGFNDWMPNFGFGEAGSLRRAQAEVEALDEAFASIATSGGAAKAMDTFRDFAAAAELTVSEQRDLLDNMPLLGDAIASTANESKLMGDAASESADGLEEMGGAAEDAERAVLELDDAMSALFDGLDVDAATDSWKSSLKDLTGELTGGTGALDRNTDAGQKNREAIRGQIEELRSMAEAQYNATGDVDQLRETLLKGRQAIIDQAIAAGVSRDAMERYMRQLGFTAEEIRLVTRLMRPAKDATEDLNNELDKLDGRSIRVKVALDIDTLDGKRVVPGLQEYATGGYTGAGGKYEPAGIVHRGEFVFDAQTTAMFRPFFEELHRTRRMPGYADGGLVRQISAPTVNTYHQAPSIDYDRLASAMSQVRPLYGDVNVADGRDFLRTLEQDRHRAALEGRR